MKNKSSGDLEKRLRSIEASLKDKGTNISLEQYKIIFNVIINLNDNVVKSILTIFIIFTTIVAFVVKDINLMPQIKNVLYINYAIIVVFSYYLGYLRFRIITMFKIVEEIEKREGFKYQGIVSYEKKTNWKFYSTKGLFWVVVLTLTGINTLLLIKL